MLLVLLLENNYEAADMRHCQYNAALSISQTRSASLPTEPGATKTARPFKQRGTPQLERRASSGTATKALALPSNWENPECSLKQIQQQAKQSQKSSTPRLFRTSQPPQPI